MMRAENGGVPWPTPSAPADEQDAQFLFPGVPQDKSGILLGTNYSLGFSHREFS